MTFPVFASGDVLNASDMNAVGLWKLNTTTFSSVASVSIDSVFTSNYAKYLVMLGLTAATGDPDLYIRYRAGGVDTTTSYISETINQRSTTLTGLESTNPIIGRTSGSYPSFSQYAITIHNPQLAAFTMANSIGGYVTSAGVPNQFLGWIYQETATAFDGFKILPSTATNISGTIRVYGYQN